MLLSFSPRVLKKIFQFLLVVLLALILYPLQQIGTWVLYRYLFPSDYVYRILNRFFLIWQKISVTSCPLVWILLLLQVEYDPRTIQFNELLNIFWSSHDSRQVLGQGPDVGNQYRYAVPLFLLAFMIHCESSERRVVNCSFRDDISVILLFCRILRDI